MSTLIRHKRGTGTISPTDKLKPGEIGIKGNNIAFGPVPSSGDTDNDVNVIRLLTEDDYETPLEGLGIFRTSTSTSTSTTSISKSTITVPLGRVLKVGDLVIGNTTYSYLYRITSVESTTVSVTYLQTLRGATGATGAAGAAGTTTTMTFGEILSLPVSPSGTGWRNYAKIKISTNTRGLMICWGAVGTGNKTVPVIFGQTFYVTPVVTVMPLTSVDCQAQRFSVSNVTTSNFTLGNNTGQAYWWVAIGEY